MTAPRTPIPILSADANVDHTGRRRFLKLMAASSALATAACSGPPSEPILPYVSMPEGMVPGRPQFYASTFVRRGFAHGVLIESNSGRPTKIEGNPDHPGSRGATDVVMQASVLQLWDPDRSQTVIQGGQPATWSAFERALDARRDSFARDGGARLRVLTGDVSSPTLAAQLQALTKMYPNARWHAWEPLHDDGAVLAARLAFGRPADTVLRLAQAEVVVALDADLFGDWPGALVHAREFTAGRRPDAGAAFKRLYAMEAAATLTGAFADNRIARAPQQIEGALWRIAARLGAAPQAAQFAGAEPDADSARWEAAAAAALAAHRGRGLVVAGPSLPPAARALVHRLNEVLGNTGRTVLHVAPVSSAPALHSDSIASLARDMHAGAVDTLLILDANPVYTAPADLDFARALKRVPFSAHLGLYRDETARQAGWHLPQAHCYEAWSDARAHDGTASIVQPAIAPLYGGRSAHAILATLIGRETSDYALVRQTWQREIGKGDRAFEDFWQDALRRGVVEGSAAAPLALTAKEVAQPPARSLPGIELLFRADPYLDGGEFANNAWLQELPRPLSQLTWDNAALLGPGTAAKLQVGSGDVLRIEVGGRVLAAPVWVLPEQAEGVLVLPLGYGRQFAGNIGNGVGFDAYRLRSLAAIDGKAAISLRRTGARHVFATRQQEDNMHGREPLKYADLREARERPAFARALERDRVPKESLYPQVPYHDYKWGMAIDLNACIGCGVCTIACQAENNIPVVGKEEVMRGRIMHWIRVDRYRDHARGQARTLFQPVPCMHCEQAPCEEVCPVGATVHDSEGLNVQVYNRCVGTRFCSNNCPYKVRRFNFLQYSNQTVEQLKAAQNPDVTVRRRGVMEKCSYCLQRITRARIDAEKLGRRIQDGEVVSACQAACPTRAIVFGDLNDKDSAVVKAKSSPLDYAMLAELNTHPRTSYGARVVNPDPELE